MATVACVMTCTTWCDLLFASCAAASYRGAVVPWLLSLLARDPTARPALHEAVSSFDDIVKGSAHERVAALSAQVAALRAQVLAGMSAMWVDTGC